MHCLPLFICSTSQVCFVNWQFVFLNLVFNNCAKWNSLQCNSVEWLRHPGKTLFVIVPRFYNISCKIMLLQCHLVIREVTKLINTQYQIAVCFFNNWFGSNDLWCVLKWKVIQEWGFTIRSDAFSKSWTDALFTFSAVHKYATFCVCFIVLDQKETTFMNGDQLYWGLQVLCMKEEFFSLTLHSHQTIPLNHLR